MILLDAGHGGVTAAGEYTTWPGKMAVFDANPAPDSKLIHEIDGKFYFFEGEFNRLITGLVRQFIREANVPVLTTYDPIEDTPLKYRVFLERNLSTTRGKDNVLTMSTHANASNSRRARGIEVFTHYGVSNSDVVASYFLGIIGPMLDMIGVSMPMRLDYFSDGDADKEAGFYILRETYGSAILIEYGFMDNYDDVKILCNPEAQRVMAKAQALTGIWFHNQDKEVKNLGTAVSTSVLLPPKVINPKLEP